MGCITASLVLLCLFGLSNANFSPEITQKQYEVCEGIAIGELAFTIQATDPENDKLTYSISAAGAVYFTVDKDNGEARVKQKLDREAVNVLQFDVTVSDDLNPTTDQLNIALMDDNDNAPIFGKPSYNVEVNETAPINQSLITVVASDQDTGVAASVTYSIVDVRPESGRSLFSINSATGLVTLTGPLNYTTQSTFYQLAINATDGGGGCSAAGQAPLSNQVMAFITVEDVPDQDPQFVGLPYSGRVTEHSAVGTTVLTVTAIDPDTGVSDKITYSIESPGSDSLFSIGSESGTITVSSDIDREALTDFTVTLIIKATESKPNINGIQASATATVNISIDDINDNKPEFFKCTSTTDESSCVLENVFTAEVAEHTSGSISLDMRVSDKDLNPSIKLTLAGPDSDIFAVNTQYSVDMPSYSIVQLQVAQPSLLDYERQTSIVVEVIATDEANITFSSTATVTITITDINDNSPLFKDETYKLEVPENSPDGTSIANITATDSDTMDKDKLEYILLPESIRQYFDVKLHTGEVYVKDGHLLNREERSLYSATLQANDTAGKVGSTVLEITVTDVNDERPVFNRQSYQEFVQEGNNFALTIEATDADEYNTPNSKIEYSIEPSEYSDNFTINNVTGVLSNNGELDREALDPALGGNIFLTITATDKGTPPQSSNVTVQISVQDANDNAPQFEAPSYNFTVKEGVRGAFVGQVEAKDLDQTKNFRHISFSLIDGFGFIIQTSERDDGGYNGTITVDPNNELDYESDKKEFELRVEATDLELNRAEVRVSVKVLNVNDERPEFNPSQVVVNVKENTNISEAIGQFTATDTDENHSLVYQLVSMHCECGGNTTNCNSLILDPNGEVRLNPEINLDYEECSKVIIKAQVVDENTEKGENNSLTAGEMVVNIVDVNDNAPEFVPLDSVLFVVSETASVGTSIGKVSATDKDSEANSKITFSVTEVQFEDDKNEISSMPLLFTIDTAVQGDVYTGTLISTEGLDVTLKGKYLVKVSANDAGGLVTYTTLEIFTIDETYRISLQFDISSQEIRNNLDSIRTALTAATAARVEVVDILDRAATRNSGGATLYAYFVYTNGTALTADQVEPMLAHPDHYPTLIALGLETIGGDATIPVDRTVQYVLLGIVAGLVVVLIILTISLTCTRKNYKRKLKAAKAVNAKFEKTTGPVMPGTNIYTKEGANPVLNLNIDTAAYGESSDDNVSLNSLDNGYDMTIPERETVNKMLSDGEIRPPEYVEALGAALAQQDKSRSHGSPRRGFDNHAFNTTDL
ncbi:uncharacterized protein V6R79_001385 [Siganus canaliculatus]